MKPTEVIITSTPSSHAVKYVLTQSNVIYVTCQDLINSYVLDFFTCSHWNKLPVSWKKYLEGIPPERLAQLLDIDSTPNDIAPLSFLTIRTVIRHLRIQIPQSYSQVDNKKQLFDEKIDKMFWKHVKSKKRHELISFAEYTNKMSQETNCFVVVDVGSGLGHLCRMFSYGYGLQVCGVESQEKLVHQARKLDSEFEKLAGRFDPQFMSTRFTPAYVNMRITDAQNPSEFVQIVQKALGFHGDNFQFGIVGLHPCGDLGPILLQLYKRCPNIRFVNIVGCCYMKLTCTKEARYYPLSQFCLGLGCQLSYHAREVACHAIESYTQRLKDGKHWELKVHAFRAALEKIITENYPSKKHTAMGSVKCTPEMTFREYCCKATDKLDLQLQDEELESEDIKECLGKWKDVVTFYTIRLLFAPLIESLIILDRYLYLLEDGQAAIVTVFDPKLSPRNLVVSGIRF